MFSALGFYPVCPGSGEYILGSPIFDKVTLSLSNGKKFVISAPGNCEKNRFVGQTYLNEDIYSPLFIRHEDIIQGGTLRFDMVSDPLRDKQYSKDDYPYSLSNFN